MSMNIPSNRSIISSMKIFARAASLMTILVGSLVLVGWALDISALKSIFPGLASMKANTAMAFILIGLALWLFIKEPAIPLRRRAAQVCALIIALLGLLTLIEYIFGWQLGIDQWLFKDLAGGGSNLTPGRMSPVTALNFLLLGMAMLLLDRGTLLGDRLAHILGLTIMLFSSLACMGYLYGEIALYGIGGYNQIAVHTAITFIVAAAGLLCIHPDRGLMITISSNNAGSFMARRVLPLAIILPIIVGWVRLQGQRAGFYDTAFGLALMVVASIVVFVGLVWRNARLLNQTDAELKLAQAADLRQNEERLRYVVWAIRDAIWDRNMVSGEILWNESLQKLFRYRVSEVNPAVSWWEERIHPEDRAKIVRSIRTIIETNQNFWSNEYRFQRADGSYANIFDRGYLLYDEKTGQPLRMIGAMADITEQKQAEQALRQSQELFTKAFSASPAGITLTRKADGRVIEVNDAYLGMVGYSRKEVLGKTTLELGAISLEDRAQLLQMFNGQGAVHDFEIPMRTKSGQLKDVLSSFEEIEVGGDVCILSIVYDITERKQVEAALQESEERYRLMIDNIKDYAIFMLDAQGNVKTWNAGAQHIKGYSADEIIGQHFSRFYPQEDIENGKPEKELRQATAEGRVEDEGWRVRKDGSRFWANVTITALHDKKGQLRGFSKITHDITARKQAEDALAQEQYLLNALLDNVPDYIYFKDIESRFLRTSRAHAKAFGLSNPDDVIGKTDFDFFTEEHARPAYEDEQQIIRSGQPIKKEERETWPNRPDTWVIATKMPLRNQAGEIIGTFGISTDITRRKNAEDALHDTNEDLTRGLAEVDQRNREIMLLNELGNLLQSCQTPDEAYTIIGESVPKIFPNASGALYIINASRNIVEAVAAWKTLSHEEHTFAPEDCLALRRGRLHFAADAHSGLQCKHLVGAPTSYICVPMMAQGEALGVFHLAHTQSEAQKGLKPLEQGLVETVADTIALALTNLKLRETLRNQSIRDPLTNLFNRRFMEESLDREIHRATRNQRSLGIIMLDIDHFKNFNDTFGHEAGDAVLRELGDFLQTHIRGGDIACRYGGEEFLLLLPEASLEATRKRAQKLCDEVRQLQIQYRGETLRSLTLSLGIAIFPEHGQQAKDIVRAADAALYQAKQAGRNQVAVADSI